MLRVRAEMLRVAPGWDLRVADNTSGNALYVLDGDAFDTSGGVVEHVHAASGWTGSSYGNSRSSAPFAILDVVYEAMRVVHAVAPATHFPALVVHWSPNNRTVRGDLSMGELGSSFYRFGGTDPGIYLLGEENNDTEEFDRHVIAHEWGHYFDRSFSRSDSIGGPHTAGDRLDMRVAFGEGFGDAFSAIATRSASYVDVVGPGQRFGFGFNLEGQPSSAPGWYSEQSVREIIYDLYDSGTGDDALELGFAPLYDVLVGPQRVTPAFTSIFSFIHALKQANATVSADIDNFVAAQMIAPVQDEYGTGETNSGTPPSGDVLPVYAAITVNGPAVNVCSTDDYSGALTGAVNKLGSRRYLRFTVGATAGATHTFTMTTTEAPAGEFTDPDMWLHRRGPQWLFTGPPSAPCQAGDLSQCVERGTTPFVLAAGVYLLDVYEWTNADDLPDEFSPIGRACFDVEVTSP
jgi:hypothetical protein